MLGKRQGDVGFIQSDIPEGAKKIDPTVCRCKKLEVCGMHFVLAHGEVSGHTHRFDYKNSMIELYEKDGEIFIKNLSETPADIVQTHGFDTPVNVEQLNSVFKTQGLHSPIPSVVPGKGTVKVRFPKEKDWFSGEIRRARD